MAEAARSIAAHGKTFKHVAERCPGTVGRRNKCTQTNSVACVERVPPARANPVWAMGVLTGTTVESRTPTLLRVQVLLGA